MNPKDKVALVTGGAHRVGKAIVVMLAGLGAHVVVNYRSSTEAAAQTAAEARALGVDALAVAADVADFDAGRAMAEQVRQHFGGIDILINSASPFEQTPFPLDDPAPWARVTRVLVDGPFYMCNFFAPQMLDRGGGVIINISDVSAVDVWPGYIAHAVGKAAMLTLTRQMALELAPHIRVNAVVPGPVLPTPRNDAARQEQIARKTLLGRWGTPDDVGQAVRYLIEADYVTGEVLAVDGGERLGRYRR